MNLKLNNGVTLVALVITIVILIILASVIIDTTFKDSGIVSRFNNLENKTETEMQNNIEQIEETNNELNNYIGQNSKEWTQDKTLVTDGIIIYNVGDAYDYNSNSDYNDKDGWRVLGAENGKLLIMTSRDIVKLGISGVSGEGIYEAGYTNAVDKLNSLCTEMFGATSRSVKLSDIDRVTGYDPEKTGDGKKYGEGDFDEYKGKVTYTADGSKAENGCEYSGTISPYIRPDGTRLGTNGVTSIQEESTYYLYYPYSLTTNKSTQGECKGIELDSKAYRFLFRNPEDTENVGYWLANTGERTYNNYTGYGVFRVAPAGHVGCYGSWSSNLIYVPGTLGVRAVISLD